MKLSRLKIKGFQGIEDLDFSVEPSVLIVAGPNASGKTSIRNAIQFALDGSTERVSRKSDFDEWLVNDRCKERSKALVSVTLDKIEYQRQVSTGHVTGDDEPDFPILAPWLLGTRHLSLEPHKTAAKVVMKAANIPLTPSAVVERLLAEGAQEPLVEEIKVYLRSGMDAALKESKARESTCRGEWKGITGEVYGAAKAKKWKPDTSGTDIRKHEILVEITEVEKSKAKLVAKREALIEEGDTGTPVSGMDCGECPECGIPLRYNGGKLYKRDLANEKKPEPNKTEDAHGLARLISACDQKIGTLNARAMQVDQDVADAVNKAKRAKQVHETMEGWGQLSELLSPTGIMLKMMTEAIAPLQERIDWTCKQTGWPPIEIQPDLTVFFNRRPFSLASESEKWRCDAAIAEAIAYVSGLKFFVLDRMDVLGPPDRVPLIKWLMKIQNDHDTIIVLATLKAPPPVPAGFASLWLGPEQEKAA